MTPTILWVKTILAAGVGMRPTMSHIEVDDPDGLLDEGEWEWLAANKTEILTWVRTEQPGWSVPVPDPSVDGTRKCQSEGCPGWVKLKGGIGVCDRCGVSHTFVFPGWHERIFGAEVSK